MDDGLLSESNDCGRVLVRLLSRGNAIAAELQRVADMIPPALRGVGGGWKRFKPVLPGFEAFRVAGALDRIPGSPQLIALDEESRELHLDLAKQVFHLLAAIMKYATDLQTFFERLESAAWVNYSIENVLQDPDGAQLVAEAVAQLGVVLLVLDERIPGHVRERVLVVFFRFTYRTNEASDDFNDVCHLFETTDRPAESDIASRARGYPEDYFARFEMPCEAIRMVIGRLQVGDIYNAARHYPLPEHRSHKLSTQAGLLYVVLFFSAETLVSDAVAMREIVSHHFGDAWVIAYALGFTVDLLAMWSPYPAAHEALSAAITPAIVKQMQGHHLRRLEETQAQLAKFLAEGALTEEIVIRKTPALLSCLRQANTTIKWLLLQPTTADPKLREVFRACAAAPKEQLLQALVDTALLEERVRALLAQLVGRRGADWAKFKLEASQAMDGLAVFYSGEHPLQRQVRNEEFERFFRMLQQRIDDLSYESQDDALALGRRVSEIARALEDMERYHEISRRPDVIQAMHDTKGVLQWMLWTASLSADALETITVAADLSYAWKALGAYEQTMHALLAKSSDSLKGVRALFLKLSSILEAPLRRIRQAENNAHAEIVSNYYSLCLVKFMQSVLLEISRSIFKNLFKISEQGAAQPPEPLPSHMSLADLQAYAVQSAEARHEVARLTQNIAKLMRAIRETDVTVLGVIRVEPRAILVDGLHRELSHHIESLFSGLALSVDARPRRADIMAPLEQLAAKVKSLRLAFEHVQDYVGVCALQIWHTEVCRIANFLLHMEQHEFFQSKDSALPNHDMDRPIAFPDSGFNQRSEHKSFISRTAGLLLSCTNPKVVAGGLYGDWQVPATGEVVLDSLVFEMLHLAFGPPGLAAISRFLGLRVTSHVHRAFAAVQKALTAENAGLLRDLAVQAHSKVGSPEVSRSFGAALHRMTPHVGPLFDLLSTIGQHQLLRRRIHHVEQVHAKLGAPLVTEALCALDRASLTEEVASAACPADLGLPSLDGAEPDPDEPLAYFQRRVARASELPGLDSPLRQIYRMAATCAPELDALLALVVALLPEKTAAAGGASGRKTRSRTGGGSAAPSDDRHTDTSAAFLAGMATMLQQVPQAHTDGLLELFGAYFGGLCAEGAENREKLLEGLHLSEFYGALVELLGLPRTHPAEFAPRGSLDVRPLLP